jgi:hypothetical protein
VEALVSFAALLLAGGYNLMLCDWQAKQSDRQRHPA